MFVLNRHPHFRILPYDRWQARHTAACNMHHFLPLRCHSLLFYFRMLEEIRPCDPWGRLFKDMILYRRVRDLKLLTWNQARKARWFILSICDMRSEMQLRYIVRAAIERRKSYIWLSPVMSYVFIRVDIHSRGILQGIIALYTVISWLSGIVLIHSSRHLWLGSYIEFSFFRLGWCKARGWSKAKCLDVFDLLTTLFDLRGRVLDSRRGELRMHTSAFCLEILLNARLALSRRFIRRHSLLLYFLFLLERADCK